MPFVTTILKGIANLTTHSKCMDVVVQPVMGYLGHITTARSYWVLRPGIGKIDVCLRNHCAKQITLPKQTAVGKITVANAILALLAPKPTEDQSDNGEATAQKWKGGSQKECLDKIDIIGLRDMSLENKKRHGDS